MRNLLLKALGWASALVVAVLVALLLYAQTFVATPHNLPAPRLLRATAPAALARGEVLVRTACAGCHRDPKTGQFTGTKLDFPSFLGEFFAANITTDPVAGIGNVSDELLARTIRVGLKRDGRLAAMPRLPDLSDADVSAMIGFLRSTDADLRASPKLQPESRYSLLGVLLVAFMFPPSPEGARTGIVSPARAPTAEYGRYLANGVFDCFECHTDGFGRGKLHKPGLYAGRTFPGEDAEGRKIYAPNLTPDPDALGSWSFLDFTRALRDGVAKDGRVLQPPMMRLRLLPEIELQALWAYFRSIPPVQGLPFRPRRELQANEDPARQFASLGCATCHAEGGPFAQAIRGCIGKPVADVARWIRRPHELKPDTQMPSYESLLDEREAEKLAAWIQQAAVHGAIPSAGHP